MPDLGFSVRVDRAEGPVAQALSDVVGSLQTAYAKISDDHAKLQDKCVDLSNENSRLRAENKKLQDEVARLVSQAGGSNAGRESAGLAARGTAEEHSFVLERSIKIHDAPVHSVTMSMNSEVVATASWDTTVKLYNLAAEEVVIQLGATGEDGPQESKMGGLYAVAFAKTAPEILGCTSANKSVYLWNHVTGKLVSQLVGHTDEVNGIDFHQSQQVMCTASDDCKVIIWDFQEGITLRTLDKHTKQVYGATFLGEENQYLVATCCFDQKTRIFDMRDKQVVAQMPQHTDDVIGIDYYSPKQLLATGSDDGMICVWDARTWRLQQKINTKEDTNDPDNEVKRVAFSGRSGGLLAAGCSSGRVLIYDFSTGTGRKRAQLGGHTDCVFDVTWGECPQTGAKILVSGSHDFSCRYWREAI